MNKKVYLFRMLVIITMLSLSSVGLAAPSANNAVTQRMLTPTLRVVNLSDEKTNNTPVTFGQPFHAGTISSGETVVGYANGRALKTQVNVKARNSDGSMRHAVITMLLPKVAAGRSVSVTLRPKRTAGQIKERPVTLGALLKTKFDAKVDIKKNGTVWHLDARKLLKAARKANDCHPYGRRCNNWLTGPLVSEWVVGGALRDDKNQQQKHLAVYFAVRAYGPRPIKRVRVDIIVENDWAYVANPHNEHYSVKMYLGDTLAYKHDGLTQYRQTRWHKVFWWGQPDPLYARLNSIYLQESRAVPKYENVKPTKKFLNGVRQMCPPMRRCDQTRHMSTVGAQAGIGPLPRWSSVYVVDPTYRAFRWMLANDDALGAYGVDYRDRKTGEPISVITHPCATLVGPAEIKRCPVAPHRNDIFPKCSRHCKSPLAPNEPHHPSPGYVAYLVTGDWYYLEELKYWSDWIIFGQNPRYRGFKKGLVDRYELRGQAWALRTLGYAAYILPDDDPYKSYFNKVVDNNIAWYNKRYPDNPHANKLHLIVNSYYAVGYPNHGQRKTGTAIWQQSFFAWAVGNLVDLGFKRATKLRNWVAKFQINLMTSRQYCWILASAYEIQVRDTLRSPFYKSLGTVYKKTFPQLAGVACNSTKMAKILTRMRGGYRYRKNVMIGYPFSATGFVANFQIGLAEDAESDTAMARKAWRQFMNRTVKPKYSNAPQFAILPRSTAGDTVVKSRFSGKNDKN